MNRFEKIAIRAIENLRGEVTPDQSTTVINWATATAAIPGWRKRTGAESEAEFAAIVDKSMSVLLWLAHAWTREFCGQGFSNAVRYMIHRQECKKNS